MTEFHPMHLLTLPRFFGSMFVCALATCAVSDPTMNSTMSLDGTDHSVLRSTGGDAGPFLHSFDRQENAPLVAFRSDGERLQYSLYHERGATVAHNIVPDFSRAGYRGGGIALPTRESIPVRQVLTPSTNGDDSARIQAAIDTVAALRPDKRGLRGAILLRRGRYSLADTLVIRVSGVVLRGEGRGADGTILRSMVRGKQGKIIEVGNNEPRVPRADRNPQQTAIATDYLPVGAMRVEVESAAGYRVGDTIAIAREPNAVWLGPEGIDTARYGWKVADYAMYYERIVRAVNGNTFTLDAPIVDAIETRFGGGHVYRSDVSRIAEAGIEDLRLEGNPDTGTANGTPDTGPFTAIRFGGSAIPGSATSRCVSCRMDSRPAAAPTSTHSKTLPTSIHAMAKRKALVVMYSFTRATPAST